MAKPQSIDELFPVGEAPQAAPTARELEIAEKPAFYPQAPKGAKAAPSGAAIDAMFPTGGPPDPTTGEVAGAVAKGAVRGAVRDAPVVAGAMTGFRLGMPVAAATAPVLGPVAGVIPLVTTAGGAFLGYQAGQSAAGVIPEETRPELKPYGVGGETFGSAIATAPAAFFLPAAGPTSGRVAAFLGGMGDVARRSPKTFMATEALGAGAMGLAGGAAEAFFPGQEGTRFGAELTVGLGANLAGTKLLLTGVDLAKQALSSAKSGFSNRTSATERKATNILLDAIEKSGEDPQALIKALRVQLPGSVPSPTAGQKTGSQALMDLEASLNAHRAEFGGKTAEQGRIAFLAYQELVDKLRQTGNPQALRAAAELEQKRFDNMIETRLSLADKRAADKISKITRDTPEARKQIGQLVKNETELALREARDVESQLWTAALENMTKPTRVQEFKPIVVGINQFNGREVVKQIPINTIKAPSLAPSNTVETFLDRASNMGPALFDDIPPQVRRIMDSFGVDQEAVTKFRNGKLTDVYLDTGKVPASMVPKVKDQPVQDLVNYRSTLLKMAREAAGAGNASNADFYSSLADAMMRDLDNLQDPMFDQARKFSRSLNDVFTRTYAGSVTGVTKTGKDRIPAETLVLTAFGGNADQTAQRMKEIEDAVGFIRTQYREIVSQFGKDSPQALQLKPLAQAASTNVASIRDAHMRVLRLLASRAVTTTQDGAGVVQKIKPNELIKFAQEYAPLLDKMGLMGELRDAAHASNLLTQVINENSALSKAARNQAAFAQLLSAEQPTRIVNEAINGRFPVKSINNLVALAKKGGPDAVDGLKAAIYDYAYTKAGGNSISSPQNTPFSPDAFSIALFEPLGRNQPSLVNIMRSNGLMTLQEVVNLKKLLTPMVRIQTAINNNIPYEDVIQGADAVVDLGLRVVGARLGTAAAPGGPGSLIAASAGSKAIRQIFDSLPNATVRAILENAVKDPQAMAILLQKGRTEKEKRDIANKFITYLGSLGVSVGKNAVTPTLNYLSPDERQPQQNTPIPFTPEGAAARQLRQLPKAPTSRGVPGLTDQGPGAPKPPGPGAQAPGGPPGSSRAMMQSLFPFDTISAMAAQQPPQ